MNDKNSDSKLSDLVDLNELAKHISTQAADVELMSTNALIANKNSGAQSGFSAVASELRLFSNDVIRTSQSLSSEFSKIISNVANDLNLSRRNRIIRDVETKSKKASVYIGTAVDKLVVEFTESTSIFNKLIDKCGYLLNKIKNQCLVGSGLSGFGKIESTYLGAIGGMVYKISHDIGLIISVISGIISDMKQRINGYIL